MYNLYSSNDNRSIALGILHSTTSSRKGALVHGKLPFAWNTCRGAKQGGLGGLNPP